MRHQAMAEDAPSAGEEAAGRAAQIRLSPLSVAGVAKKGEGVGSQPCGLRLLSGSVRGPWSQARGRQDAATFHARRTPVSWMRRPARRAGIVVPEAATAGLSCRRPGRAVRRAGITARTAVFA